MKSVFNAFSILVFVIGILCICILFFTYASVIAIRLAVLVSFAFLIGMGIYGGGLLIRKLL